MDNLRLRHNAAVRAAKALLEMACGLLYEWERGDFYNEAFQIILKALEDYDRDMQGEKTLPRSSEN